MPNCRKTNISYFLIRTRYVCVPGGNVCFLGNLAWFVFLLPQFWDSPFCHITNYLLRGRVFEALRCSGYWWAALERGSMAHSMHGHISYVVEVNFKRPIREKRIRKRSKVVLKKLNGLTFFFSNKKI